MRSKSVLRLFEDIADNVDRIKLYTQGYDASRFSDDRKCQDAVLHCLLRISEAARNLGNDAERFAPTIPWRDVRGIGNRLRHEYQKVNVDLIWRVVRRDISALDDATREALRVLGRDDRR